MLALCVCKIWPHFFISETFTNCARVNEESDKTYKFYIANY